MFKPYYKIFMVTHHQAKTKIWVKNIFALNGGFGFKITRTEDKAKEFSKLHWAEHTVAGLMKADIAGRSFVIVSYTRIDTDLVVEDLAVL